MKLICNYYIGNYGSVLQSTASYIALKKYNPDIEVIKYIAPLSKKAKFEIDLRIRLKYIANLKMLKNKACRIFFRKQENGSEIFEKRSRVFQEFTKMHMGFTRQYNSVEDIVSDFSENETVIIGSDQLWGPEDIIKGYHTLMWVPDKVKKISYATSFGVSELPPYLYSRAKSFLDRMDSISVREEQGVGIVAKVSNNSAVQVCDPTLLLTSEEWEQIIPKKENELGKYIFCFFIGDNPEQRIFAKKLSALTGFKIVAIQHLDKYIESDLGVADVTYNEAAPDEFINLIRNAEYVVCDSFHAMIFSVLNKKRFILFNRYASNEAGSRNSRIDSICKKLNLSERRCFNNVNPDEWINKEIDYLPVFEALEEWREESKQYIRNALGV